jgi:hypothetical protein
MRTDFASFGSSLTHARISQPRSRVCRAQTRARGLVARVEAEPEVSGHEANLLTVLWAKVAIGKALSVPVVVNVRLCWAWGCRAERRQRKERGNDQARECMLERRKRKGVHVRQRSRKRVHVRTIRERPPTCSMQSSRRIDDGSTFFVFVKGAEEGRLN